MQQISKDEHMESEEFVSFLRAAYLLFRLWSQFCASFFTKLSTRNYCCPFCPDTTAAV